MNFESGVFIRVKQAAAMLGVKPGWLYQRLQENKGPPFYRRGKNYVFRIDELEQYMHQRVVE